MQNFKIQRALLSVSDKTGIVEFAQALHAHHIEILSTGGTATLLKQHNIPVIEVADYTGFPEMMDGRVKTLHPKIHGGLLGRRGQDDGVMQQHEIFPIDLLVVNLYPFAETIAKADCTLEHAIENIDIGGPAMLRAGAKNYASVTVLVNPQDYSSVLAEISHHGNTSHTTRFELARKVFAHTAQYDGMVANYFGTQENKKFPLDYSLQLRKKSDLRYGENPHQQAAFYIEKNISSGTISSSEALQGKELSYNNIADADAALECVKSFTEQSACVIVKHANPCGVALGATQLEAYEMAYRTDPTSAFGGIIAFNTTLEAKTAEKILANQFVEIIIAPEVEPAALAITASKPNIRVMRCGMFSSQQEKTLDYKRIAGGLLIQEHDFATITAQDLRVVSKRQPTQQEIADLLFAWKVAKFVKSNAIVYAKNNMTIGIGAGQMSRVVSAKIAALKASEENLSVAGSVMASDAFFPFRDGIDAAASVGITAIIQPGGSMRDNDIIACANEHHMAMVFTGIRHFRH